MVAVGCKGGYYVSRLRATGIAGAFPGWRAWPPSYADHDITFLKNVLPARASEKKSHRENERSDQNGFFDRNGSRARIRERCAHLLSQQRSSHAVGAESIDR